MFTKLIAGNLMSRTAKVRHSSYVGGYLDKVEISLTNARYFDYIQASSGDELFGDSILGISNYYSGSSGLSGISPLCIIEIPS